MVKSTRARIIYLVIAAVVLGGATFLIYRHVSNNNKAKPDNSAIANNNQQANGSSSSKNTDNKPSGSSSSNTTPTTPATGSTNNQNLTDTGPGEIFLLVSAIAVTAGATHYVITRRSNAQL